jgi:hypothetical protein
MIDICRFPPPTLSPLTPYSMASASNSSSSAWWRKATDTEESRANSTSNLYQPLASGDRIVHSLSQLETRTAQFGSPNSLPGPKSTHPSLQDGVGGQSSNNPTSDSSKKRSRDWDQDVGASASSPADEPRVKRRVTMSSIREHDALYPENRVEELSDDPGSADEGDISPQFGHSKTTSDPSSERRKTKRFR